jgi:hypothetical protein
MQLRDVLIAHLLFIGGLCSNRSRLLEGLTRTSHRPVKDAGQ